MTEPQYDQTDADNYWLATENRALRAEVARLRKALEEIRSEVEENYEAYTLGAVLAMCDAALKEHP